MWETLKDPIWQALRNAGNLDPRILVAPDPLDQLIAPGTTYDQSLSVEPFTWLWGINCSASLAAGFLFQITDAVTGATVFSQPAMSQNFQPSNARGCIVYLSAPRYFTPPSYPLVRIVNQSTAAAQVCTVNLFTSIEIPNG
jgi:hypothetical protein